jgi:hypothetical protein
MNYRPERWRVTAVPFMGASLLAMILFASMPAAAQTQKGPDAKLPCVGCSVDGKTTPRTPDGHPDLNGFWNTPPPPTNSRKFEKSADGSILFDFAVDYGAGAQVCTDDSCQEANQPPYKPEYLAKVKAIAATEYLGSTEKDPMMACRPLGVPRTGVGAMQIVQTPQITALLYEGAPSSVFRIIYTDGRPHPADLDNTYMGDSIGHWEGDTLVVDVVGLNDDTWLGGGGGGRTKYTSIHSNKEHVTERWTRDGDVLSYQATVEDPVMFTKPWVLPTRRVKISSPGDSLFESVCTPNDTAHLVKPTEKDKGQVYTGAQ